MHEKEEGIFDRKEEKIWKDFARAKKKENEKQVET